MQALVCVSHLRWDFVWQRPQQLLSRLARRIPVIFVEEPVADAHAAHPHLSTTDWHGADGQTVHVVRLVLPAQPRWFGHGDAHSQPLYEQLLAAWLRDAGHHDIVLWLYTPTARGFVQALQPACLVYDVMDQLAAFKGAPPDMAAQDVALLASADVVFTGGATLWREKRAHHPGAHLFPSGVDAAHYARAARPTAATPPAQPVLGFFGVIDERIDLGLVAHLAVARPTWQVRMIGPVAKIDHAALPHAPNIAYPGMAAYDALPGHLAAFDVALLPFALNEATRCISPTKTLEYLAGGKPVVATPVHDVAELYGDVVRLAATPDAFVAAVEAALADPSPPGHADRVAALLARYAWDSIADAMWGHLTQSLWIG